MAFNLADMLKTVPDSGTREQIEYIPREKLRADEQNFYQISAMDSLVENIELIGLQQPLRVRADGDTYRIVSGHRRFAAITNLAAEDPQRWETIPCIVERDDASPAMQQLRLIYANNSTRVLTSAELAEQAAQVKMLLYQLKEEGVEFPGRMRDHVAEACQISKSKLGRLEVIRKGLAKCWEDGYKSGRLSEDAAYQLARVPQYLQMDLEKLTRKEGSITSINVDLARELDEKIRNNGKKCGENLCTNRARMLKNRISSSPYGWSCPGCCLTCRERFDCSGSCKYCSAEKKRHKEIEQEKKEQLEAARAAAYAEQHKPETDFLAKGWLRLAVATHDAGSTPEEVATVCSKYCNSGGIADRLAAAIDGPLEVKPYDNLPYGYGISYHNADRLCKTADLLGVSTDYLLGRDAPKPVNGWHSWPQEVPPEDGDYVVTYRAGDLIRTSVGVLEWLEGEWFVGLGTGPQDLNWTVLKWIKFPEVGE